MATKELIVQTTVKTDQIDKAVQKLGQLKDLGRGLKIQYDIDNKPIEIVIDKAKNLQEQYKLVNRELKRTKEGTAEFALLAAKQNDLRDGLDRVDVKSRELFATLSLIPGPVGDIFGKLNGVVGLLKTFSGFSLKDLNNQLKGFNDDLNAIIKGFLGIRDAEKQATSSVEKTTQATEENTKVEEENTSATEDGTVATNAGTAANQKQTEVLVKNNQEKTTSLTVTEKKLKAQRASNEALLAEIQYLQDENNARVATNRVMELSGASYEKARTSYNNMQVDKEKAYQAGLLQERQLERAVEQEKRLANAQDIAKSTLANLTKEQQAALAAKLEGLKGTERQLAFDKFLTEAQKENTKATNTNTGSKVANDVVTKELALSTQAAAFATNALNIALKGLGIGIVIGAVLLLFNALVDVGKAIFVATKNWAGYKTSAEKATIANQQLASSITVLKRSLDETQEAIKIQTQILLNQAKMSAASEDELYKITLDGYNKRVEANKQGRKRIEQETLKLQTNTKITEEERVKQTKALEEELVKNSIQANDLRVEGIYLVQNAIIKGEEERRESNKKTGEQIAADNKKIQDEIYNNTIKANDLLLKLQQENDVAKLDTERKRQDEQLKIDKKNEEAQINQLFQVGGKEIKLSVEQEKIKSDLLEQVRIKYGLKVIDLNKKRQAEDNKTFDDDQKKVKEYQDKIF